MSEKAISLLKKDIELFLRKQKDWEEEYLDLESKAHQLVDFIRGDGYEIRKWSEPRKYLLVPEGERITSCRGCFNEFGTCGTSCVDCDKQEYFEKIWELILYAPNQYMLYRRKKVN